MKDEKTEDEKTEGEWFMGTYGYPIAWKCKCPELNNLRGLQTSSCHACGAKRPQATKEHQDAFNKRYPRDMFPLKVKEK